MKWINFLHLYQPVNVEEFAIKEATEKSYLRILRGVEEHPKIKFTLNINGCLLFRWNDLGRRDIIDWIRDLVRAGRVELTGNAAYHPLLPLISVDEVRKQIIETEENLRNYFGSDFRARGFFMSEMAYSKEVACLIKELGYEWIVLDEIAYNGKLEEVDVSKVYLDKNSGLKVVFRSREKSSQYVPKYVSDNINSDEVLVTATDGELYGLRHEDPTGKYESVLKLSNLETQLMSDFVDNAKEIVEVEIQECSWESTEDELKNNKPYVLWNDRDEEIHVLMKKFADFVYSVVERNLEDENAYWARWHMVRGLVSCSFWWASGKDFSNIYGPLAWNPDEVERGVNELVRAVRALENVETKNDKQKAEKMCNEIKHLVWQKHWGDFWKE